MTEFYDVRDATGDLVWLAAREETGPQHMFVWLANQKTWRRNDALESDFREFDRDMTYVKLDYLDAAVKVATGPVKSFEGAPWVLEELLQAESRTSAELGLSINLAVKQPTTADLADKLSRSGGKWVLAKTYLRSSTAKNMASEIRTGKKRQLNRFGRLESKVEPSKGGYSVFVRKIVDKETGMPNEKKGIGKPFPGFSKVPGSAITFKGTKKLYPGEAVDLSHILNLEDAIEHAQKKGKHLPSRSTALPPRTERPDH